MKTVKKTAPRLLAFLLSGVIFGFGFVPLLSGYADVGIAMLLCIGLAGMLAAIFFKQIARLVRRMRRSLPGRIVLIGVCAVSGALVVMFCVASGLMIAAMSAPPPENATVLVLGAQIRPDGTPSTVLANRLAAAAEYLSQNPESSVIVCGGQGANEPCSEAAAMRQYLLACGIADERIILEDTSTNTRENIQNACDLIRRHGLPEQTVIATSEFHQYRAQQLAKQAGLQEPGAVSAASPGWLLPRYWLREVAAVGVLMLNAEC
ncbi:MAG: YdcF family protein [Oscillospiraceae bacterium]|nr:YdcF family protein [Oscillospiraceae bacterium]